MFCGMWMRGDLVIALHLIPIFISLRCGECKTANAFWQQVIMGLIFWSPLFFFSFFIQKEGGMGAGGSNRGLQVTPSCAVRVMEPVVWNVSCWIFSLVKINIVNNRVWQESHPPGSKITLKCIHICPGFSHCFLKGCCSFPILLYKRNNSFCQKDILFYYITTTTTHVNKLDSFSGTFK